MLKLDVSVHQLENVIVFPVHPFSVSCEKKKREQYTAHKIYGIKPDFKT